MSDGNAILNRNRRHFLGLCGKVALLAAVPVPAFAGQSAVISVKDLTPGVPATGSLSGESAIATLRLLNTHTGEKLTCTYRDINGLVPDALAAINRILRDHRTGEIAPIDPAVLDLMSSLARRVETDEPFHIISGYRSSATNETLRQKNHGVAKRSFHMEGQAVDLRLPGTTTKKLHQAALLERVGGVGHYPGSGFIHIDTGPVRSW